MIKIKMRYINTALTIIMLLLNFIISDWLSRVLTDGILDILIVVLLFIAIITGIRSWITKPIETCDFKLNTSSRAFISLILTFIFLGLLLIAALASKDLRFWKLLLVPMSFLMMVVVSIKKPKGIFGDVMITENARFDLSDIDEYEPTDDGYRIDYLKSGLIINRVYSVKIDVANDNREIFECFLKRYMREEI